MAEREMEDGFVIVELSDEEIGRVVDGEFLHKDIPEAEGFAVDEPDEIFVFYKGEPHLKREVESQSPGDVQLHAEPTLWLGLLSDSENEIRWFKPGIIVRKEG